MWQWYPDSLPEGEKLCSVEETKVQQSNSNRQIPSNTPSYIKIYYRNTCIKHYMFQP
jgi:hypothetical protein